MSCSLRTPVTTNMPGIFGTGKVSVTGPLSTIDITGFRPWKWLIDRFSSPTFCSVRKLIEERGVASRVRRVGLIGGVSTCISLRVALLLRDVFIDTFFLFRDKEFGVVHNIVENFRIGRKMGVHVICENRLSERHAI